MLLYKTALALAAASLAAAVYIPRIPKAPGGCAAGLHGSNDPGTKKYKAVLGTQFQKLRYRVSVSLRKA
ncbi:hypothetical protein BG006_002548 [Podila minutissima]|uniref:Uncharacterized protein n=1 Tax=Podila minutissima TaxID=64525 RepID=A0A9P5SRC5_9FUNG|nr:hypothetical protein BG006_002548 [Podila minutissima]